MVAVACRCRRDNPVEISHEPRVPAASLRLGEVTGQLGAERARRGLCVEAFIEAGCLFLFLPDLFPTLTLSQAVTESHLTKTQTPEATFSYIWEGPF